MNHPNRNWRARLNAAADQWLGTFEGTLLAGIPLRDDGAIRARLRLAYLAGLRDGERRKIDLFVLDRASTRTEEMQYDK